MRMMKAFLLLLVVLLPLCAAAEPAETELTVWNVNDPIDYRTEYAARKVMEKYPSVFVNFVYNTDSRAIATQMLSGEIDLLINVTGINIMTIEQYYKSGAIEDLMQYPEISQYLDQYLDIFSCVTMDGHLLGIPDWVTPHGWRVNTELLAELGLTLPEKGWTWEDFFAMADVVRAYNMEHGTQIALLAENARWEPYIMDQLTTNVHDVMAGRSYYVDDRIEMVLTDWVQAMQDGLIRQKSYWCTEPIAPDVLFQHIKMVYYAAMGDDTYIIPPVYDENTRHPVDTRSLMLNTNSKNKEVAVYFLSCYFSPEGIEQAAEMVNGPIMKEETRTLMTHDSIRGMSIPGVREPSEANVQFWLDTLKQGAIELVSGDLQVQQRQTLYPQMLEGLITPGEFLMICQQRADMMLGE